MKICFFSHGSKDNQDGASLSMLNIMEELTRRGHDVIAVMGYDRNLDAYKKNPKIKFLFVRSYNMRQPLDMVRFKTNAHLYLYDKLNLRYRVMAYRLLKDENIDIIHINGINNGIGAEVAKKLKVPYVWHIRQLMEEDLGQRLYNWKKVRPMMTKADAVIAISNDVKRKFEPKLGRMIDVIYNGVPVEMYILQHAPILEGEKMEMLLAGRMAEGKGQLEAVEAVACLKKWGFDNVHLTLIGHAEGNGYANKIRRFIAENRIEDNVLIMNHAEDLRSVRAQSDIGLLCSRREAFGRVTVETMLAGMLFVGTDTGATPELIRNGENGYMYKQGDGEDLARCLREILTNREQARKAAVAGFEEAKSKYSITRVVDEVLGVYERCLSR